MGSLSARRIRNYLLFFLDSLAVRADCPSVPYY